MSRLTPEMSSRKLQALGFIRRYWREHDGSPSYSEIGAGIGVSKERVYQLVRALERDGRLRRRGGARAIELVLPTGVVDVDAAIALLKARGFIIDEEGLGLLARGPFTTEPLPQMPDLSHIPDIEFAPALRRHADGGDQHGPGGGIGEAGAPADRSLGPGASPAEG